jgi:hypothetical protein
LYGVYVSTTTCTKIRNSRGRGPHLQPSWASTSI